jgi:hypothetical protein
VMQLLEPILDVAPLAIELVHARAAGR